MALASGVRLGQYEILAAIGKGGMGEVYRARDAKLERDVAIKVLPDELASDRERSERFQREAKLLAQLNHPNIATLYGLEQSEGRLFLVMELVEGETLAERIARGPIPVDEVRSLFAQIAAGLEAAHDKGIVHRDLKPANLMITPDGTAKILDFGLAKTFVESREAPALSQSPTVARNATAAGIILGTAAYMSPEQARGKTVGNRTDVWAFGCCFFEAITGRPAFRGETVADILAAVLEHEPDWEKLPVATPPLVRRLLHRCLTKSSTDRLRHIGDARLELEEPTVETTSVSTSPVGISRLALVAVGAAILGALAVFATGRTDGTERANVERFSIPFPDDAELYLTGDFSRQGSVAIAPDGRHVAYVAATDGTLHLYLRSLDQVGSRRIEGTDGAKLPFFSPDGKWVGFFNGSVVAKVAVTGRAPVIVSDTGHTNPRGASWAPDGSIVFGGGPSGGLVRLWDYGGDIETLTVPDREHREKTHRFPIVLPDGEHVLFTLATGDIQTFDDAALAVYSFETGEYRRILEGGSYARYSPTGHIIYARAGALLAVPFDLETLEVTGTPVTVIEGVTTLPLWAMAAFDLSPEGSLVYAPGDAWREAQNLVWVDRQGASTPLLEESLPVQAQTFGLSPDGETLAFTIGGASNSVWLLDLSRGTVRPLGSGFDHGNAIWTPDGGHVLFYGAERELFRRTPDGNDPAEALGANGVPYSLSPDGEILTFVPSDYGSANDDLWMLHLDTGKTEALLQTPANEVTAAVSPDGKWFAYRSDETGRDEIFLQSFPELGQKRQVSTHGGAHPKWHPRGGELFYRNGPEMLAVDIITEGELVIGDPEILFERPSAGRAFVVDRDGERFIMVEPADSDPIPTELVLVQNWFQELERIVSTEN